MTSAQDMINKLIMKGTAKVEVLQALCLLALCDMFGRLPTLPLLESCYKLIVGQPNRHERGSTLEVQQDWRLFGA